MEKCSGGTSQVVDGIDGCLRCDSQHTSGPVGVGRFGYDDGFGRACISGGNAQCGIDVLVLSPLVRIYDRTGICNIVALPPDIIDVAEIIYLIAYRDRCLNLVNEPDFP